MPRPDRPEPPEPGTPHAPEQAGHVRALREAWEQAERKGETERHILKEIYDLAKDRGHSAEALHEAHTAVNEGRLIAARDRLR